MNDEHPYKCPRCNEEPPRQSFPTGDKTIPEEQALAKRLWDAWQKSITEHDLCPKCHDNEA